MKNLINLNSVKEIKLSFMLEWEISAVMMFSCVKSFTAQTGHSYLKNYVSLWIGKLKV